jgi:holo-[acyl-carrier protein] synthase
MPAPSVGIDMIEIGRIDEAVSAWRHRFLDKVFTPAEQEYCGDRIQSLAARFAGKEAVMKALGAEFTVPAWKDIEILSNNNGSPCVLLRGETQRRAWQSGYTRFSISLSHCKKYAIAVCYVN